MRYANVEPLRPRDRAWAEADMGAAPELAARGVVAFRHPARRLTVLSEVANTEEDGPSYYVSVTEYGNRCSNADLNFVRTAFGMPVDEWHPPHGGNARHLFMPVAED